MLPMRRVLVRAAAIALGGAVMLGIPAAQNVTTQIDISKMNPGFAPDSFTFFGGRETARSGIGAWWRDPTASDRQVIAQTSKDPTDYRCQLAVYGPISAKNDPDRVAGRRVRDDCDQEWRQAGLAIDAQSGTARQRWHDDDDD
jgi:hypothetical protein